MGDFWCFYVDDDKITHYFNIVTAEKKDDFPTKRKNEIDINTTNNKRIENANEPTDNNNNRTENANNVIEHYNNLNALDREEREESVIKHLRLVNNLIKQTLISNYCPKDAVVLDLACGKGGDLGKWNLRNIKYYAGVDIAGGSVKEAVNRFKSSNWRFKSRFASGDLGRIDLTDSFLKKNDYFDIVSMQFALHYLFESEEQINMLFKNASQRLKPGGYFIGTISDGNAIARLLRSGLILKDASGYNFSNEVCSLVMDEENYLKHFTMKENPYGVRYKFFLKESVEGLDEFLVPPNLLHELAEKYGFKVILSENLNNYFSRIIDENSIRSQLEKRSVFDKKGTIPNDQWCAIHMYRAFVFQKQGGTDLSLTGTENDDLWKDNKSISETDIIDLSEIIY